MSQFDLATKIRRLNREIEETQRRNAEEEERDRRHRMEDEAVRNEILEPLEFEAPEVQHYQVNPRSDENLSESDTRLLLKLVLGMAMDQYGYIPNADRNVATGDNRGSISASIQNAYARVGRDEKVDRKDVKRILEKAAEVILNAPKKPRKPRKS